jgi:hypothetical protein
MSLAVVMAFEILAALALGFVIGRIWQIRRATPSRRTSQFFWMMQLPPAAFSLLHNLVASSADAKGPTRAR